MKSLLFSCHTRLPFNYFSQERNKNVIFLEGPTATSEVTAVSAARPKESKIEKKELLEKDRKIEGLEISRNNFNNLEKAGAIDQLKGMERGSRVYELGNQLQLSESDLFDLLKRRTRRKALSAFDKLDAKEYANFVIEHVILRNTADELVPNLKPDIQEKYEKNQRARYLRDIDNYDDAFQSKVSKLIDSLEAVTVSEHITAIEQANDDEDINENFSIKPTNSYGIVTIEAEKDVQLQQAGTSQIVTLQKDDFVRGSLLANGKIRCQLQIAEGESAQTVIIHLANRIIATTQPTEIEVVNGALYTPEAADEQRDIQGLGVVSGDWKEQYETMRSLSVKQQKEALILMLSGSLDNVQGEISTRDSFRIGRRWRTNPFLQESDLGNGQDNIRLARRAWNRLTPEGKSAAEKGITEINFAAALREVFENDTAFNKLLQKRIPTVLILRNAQDREEIAEMRRWSPYKIILKSCAEDPSNLNIIQRMLIDMIDSKSTRSFKKQTIAQNLQESLAPENFDMDAEIAKWNMAKAFTEKDFPVVLQKKLQEKVEAAPAEAPQLIKIYEEILSRYQKAVEVVGTPPFRSEDKKNSFEPFLTFTEPVAAYAINPLESSDPDVTDSSFNLEAILRTSDVRIENGQVFANGIAIAEAGLVGVFPSYSHVLDQGKIGENTVVLSNFTISTVGVGMSIAGETDLPKGALQYSVGLFSGKPGEVTDIDTAIGAANASVLYSMPISKKWDFEAGVSHNEYLGGSTALTLLQMGFSKDVVTEISEDTQDAINAWRKVYGMTSETDMKNFAESYGAVNGMDIEDYLTTYVQLAVAGESANTATINAKIQEVYHRELMTFLDGFYQGKNQMIGDTEIKGLDTVKFSGINVHAGIFRQLAATTYFAGIGVEFFFTGLKKEIEGSSMPKVETAKKQVRGLTRNLELLTPEEKVAEVSQLLINLGFIVEQTFTGGKNIKFTVRVDPYMREYLLQVSESLSDEMKIETQGNDKIQISIPTNANFAIHAMRHDHTASFENEHETTIVFSDKPICDPAVTPAEQNVYVNYDRFGNSSTREEPRDFNAAELREFAAAEASQRCESLGLQVALQRIQQTRYEERIDFPYNNRLSDQELPVVNMTKQQKKETEKSIVNGAFPVGTVFEGVLDTLDLRYEDLNYYEQEYLEFMAISLSLMAVPANADHLGIANDYLDSNYREGKMREEALKLVNGDSAILQRSLESFGNQTTIESRSFVYMVGQVENENGKTIPATLQTISQADQPIALRGAIDIDGTDTWLKRIDWEKLVADLGEIKDTVDNFLSSQKLPSRHDSSMKLYAEDVLKSNLKDAIVNSKRFEIGTVNGENVGVDITTNAKVIFGFLETIDGQTACINPTLIASPYSFGNLHFDFQTLSEHTIDAAPATTVATETLFDLTTGVKATSVNFGLGAIMQERLSGGEAGGGVDDDGGEAGGGVDDDDGGEAGGGVD